MRATPPGQVNSVDPVAVHTAAGVAPDLPASVGVLYNDGSREDLPVEWDAVDPADYATDGEFIGRRPGADRAAGRDGGTGDP